jgi:hypothetical protein
MGPISVLFPNPAVKILEEHLWEEARKRYLTAHPSEQREDPRTIMRKVKTEYRKAVAATVQKADHKVRARWAEFKQGMVAELRKALATVFRMSELDWYSVEVGQLNSPDAIAVPYELLKYVTASLLSEAFRKEIDFENLDNETLEALATYAAGEKFREVLDKVRRKREMVEIGNHRAHFAVAEVIPGDAYFLDEENHHSLLDMVILSNASHGTDVGKSNPKAAVKRWFHEDRKKRKNDRRFAGASWEITFEQLKSWATKA